MKAKDTLITLVLLIFIQCNAQTFIPQKTSATEKHDETTPATSIRVGADAYEVYLPLLKGKKIGVVTNQTGVIPSQDNIHLVDFLLNNSIAVSVIFSPEHGFRGTADAGELIQNGRDSQTGLPIISLYGKNKKPTAKQLEGLDLLLFDLQDVGVRFYTYISTLHYVMEAASENNLPLIVLDRPNPNAHYIDGPILVNREKTFVGMHPVPIVYGMTIGEYATMINGEKWLKNQKQAQLTIIKLKNYNHQLEYDLPVRPSPNLPNKVAISLYPSLCLFEGTNVSVGRGTDQQFQVYGSPYLNKKIYPFKFIPRPNEGAKTPKHNGKICYGENLSQEARLSKINLTWLIKAYKNNEKQPFFTLNAGAFWIDKLAGNTSLRKQIEAGWSEDRIRQNWQQGLADFMKVREKYLLYP